MTNPDNVDGLLPCPFCGHDESLYIEHVEGTIRHPAYYVRCDYCGAQTGSTDSGEHVKKWNERAELCRAAPAGGDELRYGLRLSSALTEELRTLGVDYDPADTSVGIMSDCWHPSTSDLSMALGAAMGRIKPDSAPAGSGEAGEMIARLEKEARLLIGCIGRSDQSSDVRALRDAAALLRKLSPAGSGEIEALVQKLYEDAARFNSVEVGYRDMMKIRATLLRKLQQGAE